jgi:EPS-associated MarR family transcriptional regulator
MLTDEMRYKLMRILQENPKMSQRAMARELGVSLGKVNFCLRALIGKGLVKVKNFGKSRNKVAYAYLLTPRGIEQKTTLTIRYLKSKTAEFELLRSEIAELQCEVQCAFRLEHGNDSLATSPNKLERL